MSDESRFTKPTAGPDPQLPVGPYHLSWVEITTDPAGFLGYMLAAADDVTTTSIDTDKGTIAITAGKEL